MPKRIRELNDRFRKHGPERPVDMIVFSGALAREDIAKKVEVLTEVRGFDDFPRNGQHDFGEFRLRRHRICFKIDYYDLDAKGPSPDPANPEVTRRVLTIMYSTDL